MPAGIDTRHARSCRSRNGGRCNCTPTYQAYVYDRRTDRLIRKTFRGKAEARTWRQDAIVALRRGVIRAPVKLTVREGLHGLLDGMTDGSVLDRSGKPYKPATCRSYEQAVRRYLEPALGSMRMDDVRRRDVQAVVDRLRADGLSLSTVHNKLDPLRVLFRRAVRDELVAIDPTDGLELPAVQPARKTVASQSQAEALIAAVAAQDRALWACAFYAGLRRGELRALRWSHVDFDRRSSASNVDGTTLAATRTSRRTLVAGRFRLSASCGASLQLTSSRQAEAARTLCSVERRTCHSCPQRSADER
jgi:integrase